MTKTLLSPKGIEKDLVNNTGLTRKKTETQDKWIRRLCAAALDAKNENIDDLNETSYDFANSVGDAIEKGKKTPNFDGTPIGSADADDEDDEDEKPAKKKAKAVVEDDEDEAEADDEDEADESDDEEEVDEDEEEEKPAKKAKKSKVEVVAEADDDDEEAADDADEDGEEESQDDEDAEEESDDEEEADESDDEESDEDEEEAEEITAEDGDEDEQTEIPPKSLKQKRLSKTNAKIVSGVTGEEVSSTEAFRLLVLQNIEMLDPYTAGSAYDRRGLLKLARKSGIKIGEHNQSAVIHQTRSTLRAINSLFEIRVPVKGVKKDKTAKADKKAAKGKMKPVPAKLAKSVKASKGKKKAS